MTGTVAARDPRSPDSRPLRRRSVVVRVLLALLVGEGLFIGLPALLAPRWFYDTFPFGTGWLQQMGPYSQHFVVDTGSLYTGLTVATIVALGAPSRARVQVAAIANLAAAVPHAIYHTIHWAMVGALATTVVAGTLWFGAVVSVVLLVVTPASSTATQDRATAEDRPDQSGGCDSQLFRTP